jgi:hypothetical protein
MPATKRIVSVQDLQKESVKDLIGKLPPNWQELILQRQMAITDRLREENRGNSLMALALLCATGSTVGELESGIAYRLDPQHGLIVVISDEVIFQRIAELNDYNQDEVAKKCNKRGSGEKTKLQPRIFFINESARFNPAVDYLYKKLSNSPNERFTYFSYKADRMTKLMREHSGGIDLGGLSKKLATTLNAGLFRYQLSADLAKSGRYSGNEIAEILGLKSIQTLKRYPLDSKRQVPQERFITLYRRKG